MVFSIEKEREWLGDYMNMYLKAIEKGVYVNVIFNYTQNKEKWMNN